MSFRIGSHGRPASTSTTEQFDHHKYAYLSLFSNMLSMLSFQ